jgi:hypothetical protein
MKLDERISGAPPSIAKWMQLAAKKVNDLAAGVFSAREGQLTAAPTTGTHAQGDIVWNSNPVEAGVALSKYVVIGWICTVGGTPGTFLPMRVLTGN